MNLPRQNSFQWAPCINKTMCKQVKVHSMYKNSRVNKEKKNEIKNKRHQQNLTEAFLSRSSQQNKPLSDHL